MNGSTYTVSVEQIDQDKFRVSFNGEVFDSERVTKDEMVSWVVRSGEETVRAQAKISTNDKVDVWLAGMLFPASVHETGLAAYPLPPPRVGGKLVGGEIRALMPGRVTSVLVKQGDPVGVGTPLLILEAMKMQNEIASPVAGRVKSIMVQEGATVKKDSILIEIE